MGEIQLKREERKGSEKIHPHSPHYKESKKLTHIKGT
jgi:hypothetical protein